MQKMIATTNTPSQLVSTGRPTVPLNGRQPIIERKLSDPSSVSSKGDRYPIPSFFEYRIKQKEFDPL